MGASREGYGFHQRCIALHACKKAEVRSSGQAILIDHPSTHLEWMPTDGTIALKTLLHGTTMHASQILLFNSQLLKLPLQFFAAL